MLQAKVIKDDGMYYLLLTHNEHQWTAVPIKNIYEMQDIIACLAERIALEKSKVFETI